MAGLRVMAGQGGKLYSHLFVRPDGRQLLFVWDPDRQAVLEPALAGDGADPRGATCRECGSVKRLRAKPDRSHESKPF
jgi:hypothetical protein